MEFNINILDSFPSLTKIPQKNDLILEFNNKEYFLNKLIFQQEIISSKKSLSKFYFKIYLLHNSKKILIGANNITQDLIKFDNNNNKSFITWLEFRKRNQESNKEISDLNILFFDCIRLKIKITLIRKVPKTDKRIKTTKSKIKVGAKTPIIPKKEELKYNDKNDNIEINNNEVINLNSYRIIDNNYMIKSKSQEENEKINNNEELENKIANSNNIIEKYNNLQIKSEDSISHEAKNLLIDNDCILTDNNLFENYSYSTSLGDNNNKNILKYKAEFENKLNNDNKNDNINSAFTQKNSLMSLDNYKYMNKQEKNNVEINNSFDDDNNKNKKIKIMKSKFKSMNKLIKANKNSREKKFKKVKNNLMNKSNTNKTLPLIKEQVFFNTNTYNNFYKKKQINDENNNNYLETNVNNDNTKSVFLNNLLISHDKEINNYEVIKVEKSINRCEFEEFISMKKDYDLLYTPVFIKETKKDLLDLEFNIALEKSISLFLSYNDHTYLFHKQKKDLYNKIKNWTNKIKILNKKQNLLKTIKTKNELKEKNKLILNEFDNINLKRNYIAQKNIFENLINDRQNKKIMLKSIINILLKKKPEILENAKQAKKQEKENINFNEISNNKYIIKSPSRNKNKSKIKSPQVGKQKQQFEFMSEIKNKNSLFNNKLMNKKKSLNKNLRKNRSINYLVSIENNNERNCDKNKLKENKATFAKDNLIYYSTAKNKFYHPKNEKGK